MEKNIEPDIADLPEKSNMSSSKNLAMMKIKMNGEIENFLNLKNYTPATAAGYRYHLLRMFTWLEGKKIEIADLSPTALNSYLSKQGWKSNNTKRQAGNAAKSFLRWRYGAMHPALALKLPKDNAGPGRALSEGEVARLLAVFNTSTPLGWRDLAILAIMLESGLRASEVCRLELEHLDLDARRFFALVKGNHWREGIFSALTADYLATWLIARKEIAYKDCPYVFVSVNGLTKGRQLTPGGLRANFRRYGRRAGLAALSPHDLRRTMATLMIKAGAPTRLVQELGGWSDVRMVERYTRTLEPQQIDRYSPLLKMHTLTGF